MDKYTEKIAMLEKVVKVLENQLEYKDKYLKELQTYIENIKQTKEPQRVDNKRLKIKRSGKPSFVPSINIYGNAR